MAEMGYPVARRPSVGFVCTLAIWALAAAFVLWGALQPDLDRVWFLENELEQGIRARLDKRDRQMLEGCLARWPELAGDLLDGQPIGLLSAHRQGWLSVPAATVLRVAGSETRRIVHFDVELSPKALPLTIEIRGRGWQHAVQARQNGPLDVPLPRPPERAEVISVELEAAEKLDPRSAPGVRIAFPGAA
ncbi:MAG: hypothetical protein JXR96_15720 [Deltaproteobacteria bacterium]|nr:hypothetical protein [Deltaproteobacteria bacterium]